MERDQDVTITLTATQIASVLRDASRAAGLAALLSGPTGGQELQTVLLPLLNSSRISRSTIRALLILCAFPPDGTYREVSAIPKQIGLSLSTTHRYVRTWVALGLLEQDPESRRYRRPSTNTHLASDE